MKIGIQNSIIDKFEFMWDNFIWFQSKNYIFLFE